MSGTHCDLALIIPCYNEAKTVYRNMAEVRRILGETGVAARIVLIDDGSKDKTWSELCRIEADMPDIVCLRFSRNFGKEAAICAGLDNTDAKRYVVMDSDLQHPPHYIADMLRLMDETGVSVVEGVKADRGKESLKYKLLAKSFYRILKSISGLELDNMSDFKLLDRDVVDALREMGEGHVFFRGLVSWVGFERAELPFTVAEREGDTSKFSTRRLIGLALNAMMAHTSKPLFITNIMGFIYLVIAAALGIYTLVSFFTGNTVSGFTTLILVLLFIGSMIMLSLGIIGAYIARIYDEVKRRPRYIISVRKVK